MGVYEDDIKTILSHRHDNGADFWAGPESKIYVGNPYSTISSLGMLHELGVNEHHEAVKGGLALITRACREDGKIRLGPKAPLYPCYTAEAARILCRFEQERDLIQPTLDYFLANAHESGGWRCNFTRMGKGPETEYANPGATLNVLDVLRFFPEYREGSKVADHAVQFLLEHWETRKPLGPCHWGIGSLFMQIEFPFLRYNLFYYLYALSFYTVARSDSRFTEALAILESRLGDHNQVIVERPHRGLKELEFCVKNRPSEVATKRYKEIVENLG